MSINKLAMLKAIMVSLGFTVSTAHGQIIYVDANATGPHDGTNWCNAFLTLQDALIVAVSGDTVQVAEGTYMPDGGYTPVGGTHVAGSGDQIATFQLIDGVALEGGYAGCGAPDPDQRDLILHETTLSGDLSGNDADHSCAADSPDCDSNGAFCVNLVCIIRDNNAENSFQVVTGSGTNETAILDGFTITAGNATGPMEGTDHNDRGGGMYSRDTTCIVTNCRFSRNSAKIHGGGMYNASVSSPMVVNCVFSANSAGQLGGGMYNSGDSSPSVTNCVFSANSGQLGGGMYNYINCNPMLKNCTFSENLATDNAGAIGNQNSNPIVCNCILWDDTPNEIFNSGTSTPIVSFSDIQGGLGAGTIDGGGNIDADPQFDDADLRLSLGSLAIDAGSDACVTELEDLDGNRRIVNCIVDMGAYEHPTPCAAPDPDSDGDGICDACDTCPGFNDSLPCPIPAVTEWGLIVMSLLVLTAGTMVYARRQPRP